MAYRGQRELTTTFSAVTSPNMEGRKTALKSQLPPNIVDVGIDAETILKTKVQLVKYYDKANGRTILSIYHNDYRPDWIARHDPAQYTHQRAQGQNVNDVTSFYLSHRQWGPTRAQWPNVLFKYEPDRKSSDRTKPEWLYVPEGWLVLDFKSNPVYDYDMPATLSSVCEDWALEAIMRINYHENIGVQDLQARMPGVISADGKHPSRTGTVSMRMIRFRKTAGCITWSAKTGSDEIREYMDSILPEACKRTNSTRNFRNLHAYERAEIDLQNIGRYPHKARVKNFSIENKYDKIAKGWKKYNALKRQYEIEHNVTIPVFKTLQDYLDAAGLSEYEAADEGTSHTAPKRRQSQASSSTLPLRRFQGTVPAKSQLSKFNHGATSSGSRTTRSSRKPRGTPKKIQPRANGTQNVDSSPASEGGKTPTFSPNTFSPNSDGSGFQPSSSISPGSTVHQSAYYTGPFAGSFVDGHANPYSGSISSRQSAKLYTGYNGPYSSTSYTGSELTPATSDYEYVAAVPESVASFPEYDWMTMVPTSPTHMNLNDRLLEPTRHHYHAITRQLAPPTDLSSSYGSQYYELEDHLNNYCVNEEIPMNIELVGLDRFDSHQILWNVGKWYQDLYGPRPEHALINRYLAVMMATMH